MVADLDAIEFVDVTVLSLEKENDWVDDFEPESSSVGLFFVNDGVTDSLSVTSSDSEGVAVSDGVTLWLGERDADSEIDLDSL